MKNSKNIFLRIIVVLVLLIPSYFAVYNIYVIALDKFTVENVTKVEIIGLDDEVHAEYTVNGDIKLYIKTLDNATKVNDSNRPLEYEKPLLLKFYKGDRQFTYGMYLSLRANDCIIKTAEGELLLMKESDAQRILNTPLSDVLYSNNKIPVGTLSQVEDSVEIYPSEGQWNLRKSGGEFNPSTVPNILIASNKAKAYQNRQFDIKFNVDPDMLLVDVKDGKEIIYSDTYSSFVENFTYDSAKDLQYVLTAEWHENENDDYYGSAKYIIDVKYYVPAKFDISRTEAEPGDIVSITAYNMSEDDRLSIESDMGYEHKFITVGTNRVALIPINSEFVGKTLNLTLTSDVNEPIDYYIKINEKATQEKNTGASDETVERNLSASAKSQKQAKYDEIFAMTTGENEKYWIDKFAMPINGTILLDYGWKITINMGNGYTNNGVNIGVAKGDTIKAANAGKVIFAGEIPDDGNLVVIDHGMGIKTWYGHLGDINVQVGDGVLKGQQIGTGGTSGTYTTIQSNLYFAVSVNNIFVNPVSAVTNGIPGVDAVSESVDSTGEEPDIPEAAEDDKADTTVTEE